jgi:hypothetical protein
VGKQAARGMVGRLSCLFKNSTHLERLAIMKSDLRPSLCSLSARSVFRSRTAPEQDNNRAFGGSKSRESLI